MAFNSFTVLYNGHHSQSQSTSIARKGNLVPIREALLILPSPSLWQLLICFLSPWTSLFWMFHMNGITHDVAFCVWLLALGVPCYG